MKKILFWVGALIVSMTIATGCSNEKVVEQVQNKKTVVTATIENGSARTSVNSLYNVVWSQGDAFTVFGDEKKGNMTLIGEGGATTGDFETLPNSSAIELTEGDVALFPAVSDNVETKSYTFPASYTCAETDAPMLGTYNGTSFSFKPLSAFIRVNASGLNDNSSHTLTITSETEVLTGEATLGANNALVPSGVGKTITVTLTADAAGSITFDAPIPAQTYTKLTITLDSANEPLKTKENFTANAGVLYEATTQVTDATSLKNALANGGNIDLDASFSMSENLNVSENTILDLNGKALDAAGYTFTVAEGKTFTIQNAASLARSTETPSITSTSDIIVASANSVINIGEGVSLTTTGANSCCIWVPGSDKNKIANNVTINTAGNLTATQAGAAAIYVNGNVTSGTINITGGSVKHEKDVAVYIAGKADLFISEGVEIEGTTGVEIRGGSITVEGGTITGNGDPATATPNGNGTTTVGSAVAVSQHTTNHAITATIKGGTFNGINALYEADLHAADKKATEVTMSVTGGTFNGKVSSQSCTNFITGGTFHDASPFDYLADNANVTVGTDLNITKAITIPEGLNVTFDLNGNDIISNTDVFVVEGTLTINDADNEGEVWASNDNSSVGCAVWAKSNGKVTINGGIYKVGHDGASKDANKANWRNDCIYARDNASIEINGGEFMYTGEVEETNVQSDGHRFLLNCRDADYKANKCSITVKGGTFHKFNPGATSSENPVANYVADGYKSIQLTDSDLYEVVENGNTEYIPV